MWSVSVTATKACSWISLFGDFQSLQDPSARIDSDRTVTPGITHHGQSQKGPLADPPQSIGSVDLATRLWFEVRPSGNEDADPNESFVHRRIDDTPINSAQLLKLGQHFVVKTIWSPQTGLQSADKMQE